MGATRDFWKSKGDFQSSTSQSNDLYGTYGHLYHILFWWNVTKHTVSYAGATRDFGQTYKHSQSFGQPKVGYVWAKFIRNRELVKARWWILWAASICLKIGDKRLMWRKIHPLKTHAQDHQKQQIGDDTLMNYANANVRRFWYQMEFDAIWTAISWIFMMHHWIRCNWCL